MSGRSAEDGGSFDPILNKTRSADDKALPSFVPITRTNPGPELAGQVAAQYRERQKQIRNIGHSVLPSEAGQFDSEESDAS